MSIRVKEKSLPLALVKAAGTLGVTQNEIGYKVVQESKGFLGFFGRHISIEAWKKASHHHRRPYPNKTPRHHGASSRPTRPMMAVASISSEVVPPSQEVTTALKRFCQDICAHILDTDSVPVNTKFLEDRLILDIQNSELANIVQKQPRFYEAMEHLLRKFPKDSYQELQFRIFVDIQGCRQDREVELIDMAQDLSNKVFEKQRPIVLNYRNSYDRKVIHMALDKDERVRTKSIGSGPHRKLMIMPSRDEYTQNATSY